MMRGLIGDLLLIGVLGFVVYVVVGKLKAPSVQPAGTGAGPANRYDVQASLIGLAGQLGAQGLGILDEYLGGPDPDNQDTGGSAFNWDELSGAISGFDTGLDGSL